MELIKESLADFTRALASKAPVPGGGGASALAGAVGIALGGMVGEVAISGKKSAPGEDMEALTARARELRLGLLACVDKDAAAFEPLSRAYAIPKDAPGRDQVMEKCLRDAAASPFEVLRLCCEAIALQRDFAERAGALTASDAGVGVALCKAALQGAALNVKANTRLMLDRAYAADLDAQVDERLDKYGKMADEVFQKVYGRLS